MCVNVNIAVTVAESRSNYREVMNDQCLYTYSLTFIRETNTHTNIRVITVVTHT